MTVVLSAGVRTPVGLTAESSYAASRGGIGRLELHPLWVDKAGAPVRAARDAMLDPVLPLPERLTELVSTALTGAVEPLLEQGGSLEASLYVAMPPDRPGMSAEIARSALAEAMGRLGDAFKPSRVVPLNHGNAAGLQALGSAHEEIQAGRTRFAVVLGYDSFLSPRTIEWLDESRLLDSDENRLGFTPGEGAAALVLSSSPTAKAFSRPPLGTLRGFGLAREPEPIGSDGVCIGMGLTKAIRDATQSLRIPEEKVAMMYCDINGQRYRNEEFMYVPLRHWAPFVDSNLYTTFADIWGDVGAATGPLLVTQALMSAARRAAPGRFALAWAGSVDGTRAATAVELP